MPTDTPHTVTFRVEASGCISAKVECTAEPWSPCRLACPHYCESWPCGHELVDGGECNAAEWLNAVDVVEAYSGPGALLSHGPIEATWDADHYCWTYPGETRHG